MEPEPLQQPSQTSEREHIYKAKEDIKQKLMAEMSAAVPA